MKKITAIAPSNIAFIKYWGKEDSILRLPTNASISMNLSNLTTTTTVEFDSTLKEDDITIDGLKNTDEGNRVTKHLDRIRIIADIQTKARVVSINSFPSSSGLSSSASGFAALTIAGVEALGLSLSEKELTILARLGSGSASRSIPDGFVEWRYGITSDESYAVSLYPATHWDLVDIVVIVSDKKKEFPTSIAMDGAGTSPKFLPRIAGMEEKIKRFKKALAKKDFETFGTIIEEEALEMHDVIETQNPPYHYISDETKSVMTAVKQWRKEGVSVYFTINTGHDIHLICEKKDEERVFEKVQTSPHILRSIVNYPAPGAHLSNVPLF